MNNYIQFKNKIVKVNVLYNIILLLLIFTTVGISTSYSKVSTNTYNLAQVIKEKRATINVTNKTLKDILTQIQTQTNIGYGFTSNVNAEKELFTINAKNETVQNILDELLKNSNYTYSILDDKVIIEPKVQNRAVPTSQQTNQNTKVEIKGKVIDEDTKKPVVGATIILLGTTEGAISDENGEFRIQAKIGTELEVSFMGMKPMKLKISKAENNLIIGLKPDLLSIESVVVTGIFTRKAESFTGSAVTLTAKDLQRVGNQNLFQSIKNLDPSLMNIENLEFGSNPNKMPELEMRGTSSFPATSKSGLKGNYQNKSNQPLFILDGFPVSSETVFDMDMNRVQSLTILKDAAAKAIYGSKAANGVVVIETKMLASEAVRISYTGSVDITAPDLTSYNMANAREKLEIEVQDGFYQSNHQPTFIAKQNLYNNRLRDVNEGLNTYWLAKPLQTGVGTKHSLSAEMGSKQVRVIGDFGYQNIQGVMKESLRENVSGSLNVAYRVDKLLIKNVMSINSNRSADSPYGSFNEYALMNPYHRSEDENGKITPYAEFFPEGSFSSGESFPNPLYNSTINTSLTNSYLEFINNFYTEWSITSTLKLTARLGITAKSNKADEFYPANHTMFSKYSADDKYRKGKYIANNGNMSDVNGDIYLNYSKVVGKNYFFFNIGGSISERKYQETIHQAEGFPSERMNNILFARQYAKDSSPDGSEGTVRDIGGLAVFAYTYDDRFLFDGTLRQSASSQFGANKRWGTFWSTGIGWNIHNEKFLGGIEDLSLLKLRASVGTTGNQNFDNYLAISTYQYYLDRTYNGFLGTYLQGMANPDLSWERKLDYNIGLDFRYKFISLKLDYYLAFTKNSLADVSLPGSNGFSIIKDNLGEVKNNGLEAALTLTPLQNENGFINCTFMVSTNKNKILKVSESLRQFNEKQKKAASDTQRNAPLPMYEEGRSMNSIWAVQSLGIDPATGNEIFLNRNGERTTVWNANDQIVGGVNMPSYTGNFGVNGEYKGFGANIVFRFLGGGQMYNETLVNKIENINMHSNVDRRVLSSRWTKPGDVKQFKRLGKDRSLPMVNGDFPEQKTQSTSRFIQDRNELDLGSINVYYDFKRELVRKIGMERLKVGFYMNDVYKWSSMGVERGTSYPFARTMSIQINATF